MLRAHGNNIMQASSILFLKMIIHDIVKNSQKVSMPKKTEIPYKTNKWIFQH